jgi:hypothetical protein
MGSLPKERASKVVCKRGYTYAVFWVVMNVFILVLILLRQFALLSLFFTVFWARIPLVLGSMEDESHYSEC